MFSINACLAITLTQYAQAQTYEISPDIECKNEEYKVVCNVENVEWIDGVVAKKFQYILELQEDTFLKHRYFEFHTQNLNSVLKSPNSHKITPIKAYKPRQNAPCNLAHITL